MIQIRASDADRDPLPKLEIWASSAYRGSLTLPAQLGDGCPAGVVADYIEEYHYVALEAVVGAPATREGGADPASLKFVLRVLRGRPTCPCVVTVM